MMQGALHHAQVVNARHYKGNINSNSHLQVVTQKILRCDLFHTLRKKLKEKSKRRLLTFFGRCTAKCRSLSVGVSIKSFQKSPQLTVIQRRKMVMMWINLHSFWRWELNGKQSSHFISQKLEDIHLCCSQTICKCTGVWQLAQYRSLSAGIFIFSFVFSLSHGYRCIWICFWSHSDLQKLFLW